MGVAVATVTYGTGGVPSPSDQTLKNEHVFGTVAIDANPATYASGGLVMALPSLRSSYVPLEVRVWSEPTAGVPSGYEYQYVRGTSLANGKLVVLQGASGASAPLAEIPTAAIPAAVSGDTIRFHAVVQRQ